MIVTAFFVFTLLGVSLATPDVAKVFGDNEIVSDLGLEAAPGALLKVVYEGDVTVEVGNELTPTQVKSIPDVSWEGKNDTFYTLLMTDPDATSRSNPVLREVRHWLVLNVLNGNVKEGDSIFDYIGSGPPEGTGLHRYVFLAFEQKRKIDTSTLERTRNCSRKGRLNTKTAKLVEEFDLSQPAFGNFYVAQFDAYVPLLHQQLSTGCNSTSQS